MLGTDVDFYLLEKFRLPGLFRIFLLVLHILRLMNILSVVDIFVVIVPVLYAIVVGMYAGSFFGSNPAFGKFKTSALFITLICHIFYIILRTAAFDHPPITTVFEIMTVLAACISTAYIYIEMKTKASNTGFFILLLAFVFQLVSSLYIKDLTEIVPILRSRLLGFHVTTALLGYTAISLSAAYGFLYLMLYHEIKSSRFGLIYNRLPNLEMLEKMSSKAEVFGFLMLTIAIVIGFVWLPRAFDNFSYFDPKLIGTMVIWVLYAISLSAKRALGWQGRKMMVVSLIAFGFVCLSMTVINVYLSGFHGFH